MGRKRRKSSKVRGRPRVAKSQYAKDHKRRVGYWPLKAHGTGQQLGSIIRASGTLSPKQQTIVSEFPSLCLQVFSQRVTLKNRGARAYEIMGTQMQSAVEQLALSLTGMYLYANEAGDRPWILKTRGSCKQHPDNETKGIFSLVVCISTDAPYHMLVSSNCQSKATRFACHELSNFSYIVFPACMYHQCRAPESNHRTIMNVLVSAKP